MDERNQARGPVSESSDPRYKFPRRLGRALLIAAVALTGGGAVYAASEGGNSNIESIGNYSSDTSLNNLRMLTATPMVIEVKPGQVIEIKPAQSDSPTAASTATFTHTPASTPTPVPISTPIPPPSVINDKADAAEVARLARILDNVAAIAKEGHALASQQATMHPTLTSTDIELRRRIEEIEKWGPLTTLAKYPLRSALIAVILIGIGVGLSAGYHSPPVMGFRRRIYTRFRREVTS